MVAAPPAFSPPAHSLAGGEEALAVYLRAATPSLEAHYGLGALAGARVAYLDAGIMNYVYRVETPTRTWYLKQALPQVKQHERLGADLAGVSPARIAAEARALTLLASSPAATHFPRLAWYDAENNILWTEEVGRGAESLHGALVEGRCSITAAEHAGRLLGEMHQLDTAEQPLWPNEEEDQANWARFLRMRTTGVLAGAELPPEAEAATHALHQEGSRWTRTGMLSHLDAAPKNLLVHPDGTPGALLDFELGAARSDPAYDPGFLVGHYLLMGENRPEIRGAARQAARAVAERYLTVTDGVDTAWGERLARYAGLVMLYRLYGSSPAPYLSPERYSAIRAEGLRVLLAGALPEPEQR